MIDVLKIDVEGADTWVLYGCEQLLKQKAIRNIFFEQNGARMAELGIGAKRSQGFSGRCWLYLSRLSGKGATSGLRYRKMADQDGTDRESIP